MALNTRNSYRANRRQHKDRRRPESERNWCHSVECKPATDLEKTVHALRACAGTLHATAVVLRSVVRVRAAAYALTAQFGFWKRARFTGRASRRKSWRDASLRAQSTRVILHTALLKRSWRARGAAQSTTRGSPRHVACAACITVTLPDVRAHAVDGTRGAVRSSREASVRAKAANGTKPITLVQRCHTLRLAEAPSAAVCAVRCAWQRLLRTPSSSLAERADCDGIGPCDVAPAPDVAHAGASSSDVCTTADFAIATRRALVRARGGIRSRSWGAAAVRADGAC